MKKITTFFILTAFSATAFAQAPTANDLFEFNKSRNRRTSTGLKVLGGWAVANMGTSGYLYFNTGRSDKYFNQMNFLFNGVNLVIVGASLLPKEKNNLPLGKTLQWQSNTEATYIANAALDLVYSATGLYLTEKAKSDYKQRDRWNGWGNALIMNGGFLFLFDTSMYIVHKRNGKKLNKLMDKIEISTSGIGLHLSVHI